MWLLFSFTNSFLHVKCLKILKGTKIINIYTQSMLNLFMLIFKLKHILSFLSLQDSLILLYKHQLRENIQFIYFHRYFLLLDTHSNVSLFYVTPSGAWKMLWLCLIFSWWCYKEYIKGIKPRPLGVQIDFELSLGPHLPSKKSFGGLILGG